MLFEQFDGTLATLGKNFFKEKVPEYIVKNLNSKFELREYQKEAIGRLSFYLNDYPEKTEPTHLLFNMATGSGKTLIMASSLLFLYEQGYRNFIFFVNSTNIIKKTQDNFLNSQSSKYLFSQKIEQSGKEITIREVENFESANSENINIVFTTIQGLHRQLNEPRENALTYEDFEEQKIVLISDEAHHINAFTKKGKLQKTEEEEKASWEGTVRRIFEADPRNILLEFTATIDLRNDEILKKYEDKILFRYDLKKFREELFSKEIEILQGDLEPIDRALQAVVLSHYRRKVAEKNGIFCKPVVLMKAKDIKASESFEEEFSVKIKALKISDLKAIQSRDNRTIQKAFAYFEANDISLENLLSEIQEEFGKERCVSVNSKNESEEKQLLVNSLEDQNNEIRVVFAVDKLNEGWDVLNLFDIVRLYETRDSGKQIGKTTMAEAQLIGRGARYFPFQRKGTEEDRFKRKFDEDIREELRILEQLYYHSKDDSKYISELNRALIEIGIKSERAKEFYLNIKEDFQKGPFWNSGVIFTNQRVENGSKDISSFADAKIPKDFEYTLRTEGMNEEEVFSNKLEMKKDIATQIKSFDLLDFEENLLRSILGKYSFFSYKNLKSRYLGNIGSLNEFLFSEKYLGGVRIKITGRSEKLLNLTIREKKKALHHVLQKIESHLKTNTPEYIGTNLFRAKQVKDVFKDKVLRLDAESERAQFMENFDFHACDWYAQTELHGTSEEEALLLFIQSFIDELKKKYEGVYLVRNERFFTLYTFSEGRAFEPDFILFLEDKSQEKKVQAYQIFIEPKGKHLIKEDQWKEDFLKEIEENYEVDYKTETKDFKLIGLPFFNKEQEKHTHEFENTIREQLSLF
ncbi:DEAD/DEAH box helicase family protein [Candidatus Peregrinibacteria bacterium]|nr:MAG: DEAD/DEAH box helicase family protein [Candidatus Peregrinibacteria bacterium]